MHFTQHPPGRELHSVHFGAFSRQICAVHFTQHPPGREFHSVCVEHFQGTPIQGHLQGKYAQNTLHNTLQTRNSTYHYTKRYLVINNAQQRKCCTGPCLNPTGSIPAVSMLCSIQCEVTTSGGYLVNACIVFPCSVLGGAVESTGPNPHRTRDATRAQIQTFFLWCCCVQCGHPHSHQQVPLLALRVRVLCGLGPGLCESHSCCCGRCYGRCPLQTVLPIKWNIVPA